MAKDNFSSNDSYLEIGERAARFAQNGMDSETEDNSLLHSDERLVAFLWSAFPLQRPARRGHSSLEGESISPAVSSKSQSLRGIRFALRPSFALFSLCVFVAMLGLLAHVAAPDLIPNLVKTRDVPTTRRGPLIAKPATMNSGRSEEESANAIVSSALIAPYRMLNFLELDYPRDVSRWNSLGLAPFTILNRVTGQPIKPRHPDSTAFAPGEWVFIRVEDGWYSLSYNDTSEILNYKPEPYVPGDYLRVNFFNPEGERVHPEWHEWSRINPGTGAELKELRELEELLDFDTARNLMTAKHVLQDLGPAMYARYDYGCFDDPQLGETLTNLGLAPGNDNFPLPTVFHFGENPPENFFSQAANSHKLHVFFKLNGRYFCRMLYFEKAGKEVEPPFDVSLHQAKIEFLLTPEDEERYFKNRGGSVSGRR